MVASGVSGFAVNFVRRVEGSKRTARRCCHVQMVRLADDRASVVVKKYFKPWSEIGDSGFGLSLFVSIGWPRTVASAASSYTVVALFIVEAHDMYVE